MKIRYLLAVLAFALTSSAFSATSATVPFTNESINGESEGLIVKYTMKPVPLQQVVCSLSNFYNGRLTYKEGGVVKTSDRIVNSHIVIFTTKGKTEQHNVTEDQYHVDPEGDILITNEENNHLSSSFASCFYMPDKN